MPLVWTACGVLYVLAAVGFAVSGQNRDLNLPWWYHAVCGLAWPGLAALLLGAQLARLSRIERERAEG